MEKVRSWKDPDRALYTQALALQLLTTQGLFAVALKRIGRRS